MAFVVADETAATPARSRGQRMDALARANHIRSWRAELKLDIKTGRRSAGGLLREAPEELLTMRVFDLLLATPKQGRVKVNKMLARARISPSKTIGGLSDRQRSELLFMLGMHID